MRERLATALRWAHRAQGVVRRAIGDFVRHDGGVYAAAVAYHVLLSLFPLVVVSVAAFGLFASGAAGSRLVNDLLDQIPPGTLRNQVRAVASAPAVGSGLLGLAGLLGGAWTASGMFGALRRALNNAFDVPSARPFYHSRLLDLTSVVAILSLGLVSALLTAALSAARALAGRLGIERVAAIAWTLVAIPLPIFISTLVFLLAYRLLPNHRLVVRDLWAGALTAACGFELAKAAFGFYLSRFGRYEVVYGTLGGAAAFLVFVYLVAVVAIFGAEIAAEVAKERRRGTDSRGGLQRRQRSQSIGRVRRDRGIYRR